MKSFLFFITALTLLATQPCLAKDLKYVKLIQAIELKKQKNIIKAKNTAQVLKFTVSPNEPKVKENVTVFIQPITSFTDSDIILEVKLDGVSIPATQLEHPTADMWI